MRFVPTRNTCLKLLIRVTSRCVFFYVLLTVHRDTSVQYEPTGCAIYLQFNSIINLNMFRAGLLLIIRKYDTTLYIQQLVYVMRYID